MQRLLALLLMLPLAVCAQTPADAFLQHLHAISAMQANFDQTVRARKRVIQRTQGTMAMQRPELFRWHIQKPMDQLVVTDGQTVWVYDKDLQQVRIRKANRDSDLNPAQLLSGRGNTLVRYYSVERKDEPPYVNFALRPRNRRMNFTYLLFRFKGNVLLQMQLVDQVGQNSDVRFSQIKMNKPLARSQFYFKPPAGVDVIQESRRR